MNAEQPPIDPDDLAELLHLRARLAVMESRNMELELTEQQLRGQLVDSRVRLAELEAKTMELEVIRAESDTSRRSYKVLFDLAPVGYFELDLEGRVRRGNLHALRLIGHTSTYVHGTAFIDYVDPADRTKFQLFVDAVSSGLPVKDTEITLLRYHGEGTPVLLRAAELGAALSDEQTVSLVVIDVSEQRDQEHRLRRSRDFLERLAYHDPLTGLPNRMLFADRLQSALVRATRHRSKAAVLFIDLDGFKGINDAHGHGAGDRVLCAVAHRLRSLTRGEDTIARLAGDEFTMVLENVPDRRAAELVARKIRDAVRGEIVLGERPVNVTASIGLCMYPDDAATAEQILKGADQSMYRAKQEGRDRILAFSKDHAAAQSRRDQIERGLATAIENGELRLLYQPMLDVGSGRVSSVEALLRWQHPTLGPVMPSEFVQIAEENGAILPIGQWALDTACRQAARWLEQGMELRVGVNVSAHQLSDAGYHEQVRRTLASSGLDPERLELELTESAVLADPHDGIEALRELCASGVRLAIDDFGTGYSSLARLRGLPITRLKIDCEFVRGIELNDGDRAIAKAIIAMAHQLGLEVVSEGVETQGQMDFLREHACDAVQGFLFAHPLVGEDVAAMCADRRASMH